MGSDTDEGIGKVSGTDNDELYSKTETDNRLDGKTMNNVYDYKHQPTVVQYSADTRLVTIWI